MKICILLAFVGFACAQRENEEANIFENDLAKVCRPLDRSIDVMFILDGSGSVAGEIFDTQMKMVNRVIDMVEVGENKTRVAMLQYSGWTRMEFNFEKFKDKRSLRKGIAEVTHVSGSTRTGRALDRALQAFQPEFGGRMGREDVAQVAVVVSDGRSVDDPVPGAEALRSNGVIVMSMGIGYHVFMAELERIAGGPELAFQNETMEEFLSTFRKIAIGEQCDYAKGPNGAEILCQNNTIDVNVLTKLPFLGHLYVNDQFENDECRAQARSDGTYDDSRSVSLQIPLEKCGVQQQFLFSPRGLMFETSVMLKYHPKYNSPRDKAYSVRCFYPDMHFSTETQFFGKSDSSQIHNVQQASFSAPEMTMPCSYKVTQHRRDSCLLENSRVGDAITHQWECDQKVLGKNYGMLVHSCDMVSEDGTKHQIIDKHGCPTDGHVITTPDYMSRLVVKAEGTAVKFAGSTDLRFACAIQFCRINNGECDALIPPRCGPEELDLEGAEGNHIRRKRQLVKTELHNMPSHVMERLFGRRNFFIQPLEFFQQNGGFKVRASAEEQKKSDDKNKQRTRVLAVPTEHAPPPTEEKTSTDATTTTTTQATTTTTKRDTATPSTTTATTSTTEKSPKPKESVPVRGFQVSVSTFQQHQVPAPPAPPAAEEPAYVDVPLDVRNALRARNRASIPREPETHVFPVRERPLPVNGGPQSPPSFQTLRPLDILPPKSSVTENPEPHSTEQETSDVPTRFTAPVRTVPPTRPNEYIYLSTTSSSEQPTTTKWTTPQPTSTTSEELKDEVLEFVADEFIPPHQVVEEQPLPIVPEFDGTQHERDLFGDEEQGILTESMDMELGLEPELLEQILKQLNFMQVSISSQTIQVIADTEKLQVNSPVNWCPRK